METLTGQKGSSMIMNYLWCISDSVKGRINTSIYYIPLHNQVNNKIQPLADKNLSALYSIYSYVELNLWLHYYRIQLPDPAAHPTPKHKTEGKKGRRDVYQGHIPKHLTNLRSVWKWPKWMTTSCQEPIHHRPLMNVGRLLIWCTQSTHNRCQPSQYMALCLRWYSMSSL